MLNPNGAIAMDSIANNNNSSCKDVPKDNLGSISSFSVEEKKSSKTFDLESK